MKYLIIPVFLLIISCNGRLTDEQKKKIRNEMEEGQIKRISEAEITEAAFNYGRAISNVVESRDQNLEDKALIDSLENVYGVQILSMQTGDSELREIDRKVIEAYTSGGDVGALSDNVQKQGRDSILYTKPLMRTLADGSTEFTKALGIRMPKRQVVMSIKK